METCIAAVQWLDFAAHRDRRGALISLEWEALPFAPARLFYVYDVPPRAERGGHANRTCQEILIMAAGECDVRAGDRTYHLDSPASGLYIPAGVRLDLRNFTTDAVLLVLASEKFIPEDRVYDPIP
jgi:glyoxylate utilization-related uncharacterized protein